MGSCSSIDDVQLIGIVIATGSSEGDEMIDADVKIAGVAGGKVGDRVLEQIRVCVTEKNWDGDLRRLWTDAVACAGGQEFCGAMG